MAQTVSCKFDLEIETQTRSRVWRSSSNAPPKVNLWLATVVHAVVLQRRPASCCKVVHAAGCCAKLCNKDRGESEGSCYAAARLQVVSARLQVEMFMLCNRRLIDALVMDVL